MQERILTPDQVSQILQVHPFTVLKFIKQGKLKASKLGRVYRIRQSDLDYFLDNTSGRTSKNDSPVNSEPLETEKEVPTIVKSKNKNKFLKTTLKTDPTTENLTPKADNSAEQPAKKSGDDHYYILQ